MEHMVPWCLAGPHLRAVHTSALCCSAPASDTCCPARLNSSPPARPQPPPLAWPGQSGSCSATPAMAALSPAAPPHAGGPSPAGVRTDADSASAPAAVPSREAFHHRQPFPPRAGAAAGLGLRGIGRAAGEGRGDPGRAGGGRSGMGCIWQHYMRCEDPGLELQGGSESGGRCSGLWGRSPGLEHHGMLPVRRTGSQGQNGGVGESCMPSA